MTTQDKLTQHKPGSMDIREQEKTFHGFLRFASWVSVLSILALIFMALSNV